MKERRVFCNASVCICVSEHRYSLRVHSHRLHMWCMSVPTHMWLYVNVWVHVREICHALVGIHLSGSWTASLLAWVQHHVLNHSLDLSLHHWLCISQYPWYQHITSLKCYFSIHYTHTCCFSSMNLLCTSANNRHSTCWLPPLSLISYPSSRY